MAVKMAPKEEAKVNDFHIDKCAISSSSSGKSSRGSQPSQK
jgi:hypothetical protein